MSDLLRDGEAGGQVWRCEITGNPVGTDTLMVDAPDCRCQGCRAYTLITELSRPTPPADVEKVARWGLIDAQQAEIYRLKHACEVALGYLTGGMDGNWTEDDPADVLRAALEPLAALPAAPVAGLKEAVAEEREACAKVAIDRAMNAARIVDRWVPGPDGNNLTIHHWQAREKEARDIATTIRARGEG